MSIVTVVKDKYTVEPLYQWDKNQVLEIRGLSLASIPEIHFTNDAMDKAIVRQARMDVAGVIMADIPNSLLQKPYKITAYVCVYTGDTFESLYNIVIPVKARRKPADYTIENTDGEIYSFNTLETKIVNLETDVSNFKSTMLSAWETVKTTVNNLVNQFTQIKESFTTLNTEFDELENKVIEVEEKADEASTIAKGKNHAHVFATTDDMKTWLSSSENAGKYQVGDNLYIVATDVPDWWISEVLTTADADTGYYYKIAQLETQKVDLTEITAQIEDNTGNITKNTNAITQLISNLNSKIKYVDHTVTGTFTIESKAGDSWDITSLIPDGYQAVSCKVLAGTSSTNGAIAQLMCSLVADGLINCLNRYSSSLTFTSITFRVYMITMI